MIIIFNANIHSMDPLNPLGEAIAIQGGQIMAVGSNDEILASFSAAEKINARGHTIIPGLSDAHIHLEDYALGLQKVDCETSTRQECLHRVAERAAITPAGEWVLGHGWNQNHWAEGYGTASLLDEIAPRNPVYLTHKSLHSGWANTQALEHAGITRNSPDPTGGYIGHLPNGEPDGILYESASEILENAIPEPRLEELIEAMRKAIPLLHRFGLTGLHDFGGTRCFAALQVLHANRELRMRVIKSIPLENLSKAAEIGLRTGFGDNYLRIGSVKLFSDGALGPHTAAMLEAYEAEPDNYGMLMMDAEQLFDYGRLAVDHGISLAVHAIGDRANREVLEGYALIREYERRQHLQSGANLRHRIEHVQLLHPQDLPRFSQLGLIASMQPVHATSDMLMADRGWGARSAYAYAWRSLFDHHIPLAFGSDAPVESPNPFLGIHAAVTRQRADGTPSPQGWYPEQRLSVDEAINGFTFGAAYAAGVENQAGKLAMGFLADLLVLDTDPFTCDPAALPQIKPLATMLGGEWAYSEL